MRQFLTDPRLWRVVGYSCVLSALVFAGLWSGLGWALSRLAERADWWTPVLQWSGWLGALVVAVLLFPAVFGFIGGLFYETVADAVDARVFPELAPADGAPLAASMVSGAKYFVMVLVLNALALPVYFALLWVLGAGAGLYILVNGLLIGREQFDAVALRRMSPGEARRWRRGHRFQIFALGAATAALGLIPLLNFITPLIGVAAMTRLVNRAVRHSQ